MSKPIVSKITIERVVDTDPDLSYLGRYSNSDGLKSSDEIAIDRGDDIDRHEYRFFIAANVQNDKEARQNYERMESYNNQNWCMLGISAEAEIVIPDNNGETLPIKYTNATIQHIHSGGLWGIESDSDKAYIKEEEDNQLVDLKEQLKALGIKYPKNIKVERID